MSIKVAGCCREITIASSVKVLTEAHMVIKWGENFFGIFTRHPEGCKTLLVTPAILKLVSNCIVLDAGKID